MLRFEPFDQTGLEVLTTWFADPELKRRVSPPTPAWYAYVTTRPENFAWMVYEGPQAVGQVQLDAHPDQTGGMSQVVAPALRGRGFGKRIPDAFLHRPEAMSLSAIEAWIDADNSASRRCFEACGFVARYQAETGLLVYNYTRPALPDY